MQGYSFVDSMPSPTPSQLGGTGLAALMTYGTLASTPVALRDVHGDDPALRPSPAVPRVPITETVREGPFKIPATPRREQLAHKMASKAAKSLQKRHAVNLRGDAGLGLRTNSGSIRATTTTPGGWDSSPGRASVRAARRAVQEEGTTPGRDTFLSPAAKHLLGRTTATKRHLEAASVVPGLGGKARDEGERVGMDKYKRARWDPSPLGATRSPAKT